MGKILRGDDRVSMRPRCFMFSGVHGSDLTISVLMKAREIRES